jgi:hypothetical protein
MPATTISQKKSKSSNTRQKTNNRNCNSEVNITNSTKVNMHKYKVRKIVSTGNVNKYNLHRCKTEEEMLFKYKQKCSYKKRSSNNRYEKDELSKNTTKESTMLDSDSFNKKRVSFTRPFIEVIKIQSYKQYNLFQTHRKTRMDVNNNTQKENKIGCSCLMF